MAAFALTSFSRIASIALGVAGVTGVYVVWLHLKSFSYVLTTDWGKRFVVLSVFAAFLLLVRFFDQLYAEPKIADAIKKSDETQLPGVFSWLGFTLPAEMAFGVAILAVTSLLIITTPPLAPHFSFVRSATSQGIALSLTEQPYESGKFLVTAEDPQKKAGANVKNMVVTLTNQAAGIGPIVAPVEERFAGGYVFAENLLAPAGTWTINVTAQRAGAYDAAASFNVNYPQEIAESDAHAEDRTFGSFEVIHIFVALVILAASIFLYRKSSKLNQFVLSAPQTAPTSTPLTFARRGAWIPRPDPDRHRSLLNWRISRGVSRPSRKSISASLRGCKYYECLARKRSRTRRKSDGGFSVARLHGGHRAWTISISWMRGNSPTLNGPRGQGLSLRQVLRCSRQMFPSYLPSLCAITRAILFRILFSITIASFMWLLRARISPSFRTSTWKIPSR